METQEDKPMETQQAAPAKRTAKPSTRKRGAPPMINEMAAVGIGKFLTDAATSAQDKAKMEQVLAQFNQVNIVHPQNTADVVHIVVPDYSGFEEAALQARELADKDLEQVSGGEIGISAFFGTIGAGILTGVGLGAFVGTGMAGSLAIAVGATAVVSSMVIGGLVLAGAGAAIGISVATSMGVFNESPVNVGLAS